MKRRASEAMPGSIPAAERIAGATAIDGEDRRNDQRQPEGLPEKISRSTVFAGSHRLGNQRVEAHHHSDSNHRNAEKQTVGESHCA